MMFLVGVVAKFALLLILGLFAIPITFAVRRWMRAGKVKDALLDRGFVERNPGYAMLAIFLCYAIIVGGTVYYR